MNQNGKQATIEAIEQPPTAEAVPTIEQQANELLAQLQALGVQFNAVAIAPKTGAQVPLIEFLPEGWRFQVIPVMKKNGTASKNEQ